MAECAADGCDVIVSADHLMCKAHWYRVPQHLRNEVWQTWRRARREPEAYREAREAAIASLRPGARHEAPKPQGSLF